MKRYCKFALFPILKQLDIVCFSKPEIHYMVDISEQLDKIKAMVDKGQYFAINRARQYGKTTTLKALKRLLEDDYLVIWMDFQMLSYASFETEQVFVKSLATELLDLDAELPDEIRAQLTSFFQGSPCLLQYLFRVLSRWYRISQKKIILMIDEVDSATNNQVFLDFLSQLRGYYLNRDIKPAFYSVILAGVYDVKNIRRKIRPEDAHKTNSPWNIAADFDVVMNFSKKGIEGMLCEYEADHHTGMKLDEMAELIYDYTSGYPYLVSRICKLIDETIAGSDGFTAQSAAWTKQGFLEAVRILLLEKNTLFESLIGKLNDYPELQNIIYDILFGGRKIIYNPDNTAIDIAIMFGFMKNAEGTLVIANRIFEIRLYNYFLSTSEAQNTSIFMASSNNKSQFLHGGHLDMDMVMKKFVEHFDSIYGDKKEF